MRIDRFAGQPGFCSGRERASDSSLMGVLRMPGASFSLVPDAERDGHSRRLAALLIAIADEIVEVRTHLAKHDAPLPPVSQDGASSCRNKASSHAD